MIFVFVIKTTRNPPRTNFLIIEMNSDNFVDNGARNKWKFFTYFIKYDTPILSDEFISTTQQIIRNDGRMATLFFIKNVSLSPFLIILISLFYWCYDSSIILLCAFHWFDGKSCTATHFLNEEIELLISLPIWRHYWIFSCRKNTKVRNTVETCTD